MTFNYFTVKNFIWSRNERQVAEKQKSNYWIYCFTEVDVNRKIARGPYRIRNPIAYIKPPIFKLEAIVRILRTVSYLLLPLSVYLFISSNW